jgi:flagellar assembly factor FliW
VQGPNNRFLPLVVNEKNQYNIQTILDSIQEACLCQNSSRTRT